MINSIEVIVDRCYKIFVVGPLKNMISPQTFRYAAMGGANLLLSWVLFWFTYNFIIAKRFIPLGFMVMSPYIATFIITLAVTYFTGFWLQKNITFTGSPLSNRTQMFRYLISVAGSVMINYTLLKIFVEACNIYPTPSQIIASLITVIYSYFMQHHFSFRGNTSNN